VELPRAAMGEDAIDFIMITTARLCYIPEPDNS
jgi:hypothetical protein